MNWPRRLRLLLAVSCALAAACTSAGDASSPEEGISSSSNSVVEQGAQTPVEFEGSVIPLAVSSWGAGRTAPPEGEFVAVAVNELMSCGVHAGGDLVCWGDARVEGGLPSGAFTRVSLSGGVRADASGCALTLGGELECWANSDREGRNPAPPAGVFVDVSAGLGHWCAVEAEGGVICWGGGFSGHEVLADSGFVRVMAGRGLDLTPQFGMDGERVISWGDDPVCALDAEGAVTCWGGGPSDGVSSVPSGPFEAVAAASYRAGSGSPVTWGQASLGSAVGGEAPDWAVGDVCGVSSAGRLACWSLSGERVMDVPAGRFSKVAVGARHGCALAVDGTVGCWGADDAGQRGPVRNLPFEWLVGDVHCSRDEQGEVMCSNMAGAEVVPRRHTAHPYTGVPDDEVDPLAGPFADVWATDAGSCALGLDDVLVCWGDPGAGFDPSEGPFVDMAAGRLHGCGLRAEGTVVCWPMLDESMLSADRAILGVEAEALSSYYAENWGEQDDAPEGTFAHLAAGELHTCALDHSGEISCWGDLDGHGQIPDGAFTQISAAGTFTCALDAEGGSVCWGKVDDVPIPPLTVSDKLAAIVTATVVAERPCVVSDNGMFGCPTVDSASTAPWWVGPLSSAAVHGWTMCGLRDGTQTFACWDVASGAVRGGLEGMYAQVDYQPDSLWGIGMRCWLSISGELGCEDLGQSPDYSRYGIDRADPIEVPTGAFTSIAVASEHGCGIRTDRTISCWGHDVSYQIDE